MAQYMACFQQAPKAPAKNTLYSRVYIQLQLILCACAQRLFSYRFHSIYCFSRSSLAPPSWLVRLGSQMRCQGCQGFLLGFAAAHYRSSHQLTFLYRGHFQLTFIRLFLILSICKILIEALFLVEALYYQKHHFTRSIIFRRSNSVTFFFPFNFILLTSPFQLNCLFQ